MDYGGLFSGNGSEQTKSMQVGGQVDEELNYAASEDLTADIMIEKLRMEKEKEEMKLTQLEHEVEYGQKEYRSRMNKLLDAEKVRREIIEDDPLLDEIREETDNMGILTDMDLEIGLIRTSDRVDGLEIQQMERSITDLQGDIEYKTRRINKLKESIADKNRKLNESENLDLFEDNLGLWDNQL